MSAVVVPKVVKKKQRKEQKNICKTMTMLSECKDP